MRDELERSIRELESKLPELRRLIAVAEVQLAVSPIAATLAPLLLQMVRLTNETGSELRRALLGDIEEIEAETPGEAGDGSATNKEPESFFGAGDPIISDAEREMADLIAGLSPNTLQEGGPDPDVVPWDVRLLNEQSGDAQAGDEATAPQNP